MNTQEYVQSLFRDYEETAGLKDFMEELQSNLDARIASHVKKGLSEQEAFDKASAELGDVSALADELSLKKRREVFEEVYMDIRNYMPAGRVAAYVIFGVLALFGIITAFITLFAAKSTGLNAHLNMTSFFGAIMPFLTTAVVGFTYLGMTQELPSMYPVSKKRGAWYATAAGLIAFGLFTMPIIFFGTKFAGDIFIAATGEPFEITAPFSDITIGNFESIVPVIAMLIPFILPGIGLLVFLVLTEKDRLKPWAKDFHNKAVEREMEIWNDPATANRFGMFSGAIWIFAAGLFVLFGFLIGFKFSWLVFVFATAFQLLMQGLMSKAK